MRTVLVFVGLYFALTSIAEALPEAPAGFDDKSNGTVNDETHQADQERFDEFESVQDGLGPLYNAQSCRECHQDPKSGGASQVTELRAGHLGPDNRFQNPRIPIARGKEIITGRSLVNDRAICPNESFPNTEIHERVPQSETIRTTRISLNLLGDGFVEAVADETLIELSRKQCRSTSGKICGQVLRVPIVEAPGHTGVGRFGWKNQHASLLSFSGDAYLNEMGITSRLFPDEVTNLCNTVAEPNSIAGADGMDDVDHFARFIRATKAPSRDTVLAQSPKTKRGSVLFDKVGCAACHVRTLRAAPAGTKINGGTYIISDALGGKTFHPFSDFLLHDVGTGDGIVMAMEEHYGRNAYKIAWKNFSPGHLQATRNKLRTAPLWGLRLRTRLMHDGASTTFADAIRRHRGEAGTVSSNFQQLSPADREALFDFLRSL
ncbi:MAG TPA: di-heme oxidoredictase family protein [Burkholderiales bacterium]|nr:di-heme oxidoredictase family protein [Burkholderiales bacterium]